MRIVNCRVYQWEGDQLNQIEKMAAALPSSVVRAKGFVEEKKTMYLFNYVMGTWTIEKTEVPDERIEVRLYCREELCAVSVSRENGGARIVQDAVLLPGMSEAQWAAAVRSATDRLYD